MNRDLIKLDIELNLLEISRLEFEAKMEVKEVHRKLLSFRKKYDYACDQELEVVADKIENAKFYLDHNAKQVELEIKKIKHKIADLEALLEN